MDKEGVIRARKKEMEELYKHEVYEKVPIKECWDMTGKAPIGTKWVDINKGDSVHPEYRSRLVAKEIKTDKRLDLFAATPPLEAKNMLLALAVMYGIGCEIRRVKEGMKMDFIDIRRAFFHALALRSVYVQLPLEDYEEGFCGRLKKGHVRHSRCSTKLGVSICGVHGEYRIH